jgi:hypothetical protein
MSLGFCAWSLMYNFGFQNRPRLYMVFQRFGKQGCFHLQCHSKGTDYKPLLYMKQNYIFFILQPSDSN